MKLQRLQPTMDSHRKEPGDEALEGIVLSHTEQKRSCLMRKKIKADCRYIKARHTYCIAIMSFIMVILLIDRVLGNQLYREKQECILILIQDIIIMTQCTELSYCVCVLFRWPQRHTLSLWNCTNIK